LYVTTFYSFKGGVGRTLSLVNVGVELAQTGRRVLLVDFDLEAPGIHTFQIQSPPRPHPGVVEYVTDFLATRVAPDVREYVYEAPGIGEKSGRLWIMPAGKGDAEYQAKLALIDWQSLYREHEGYLFFEDLKMQLEEVFKPDYILIDSRTGHTDWGDLHVNSLTQSWCSSSEMNRISPTAVVVATFAEASPPRGKEIRPLRHVECP
jgi:MinD-like ATPase involved in chromosome partitioning or flagellar assembly